MIEDEVCKPQLKPDEVSVVMGLVRKVLIQKPKVEGLANLLKFPIEQRAIFAISHISDADVPAAAEALSSYRKVDVVILSTGVQDLKQAPFMQYAGKFHFHALDNTFTERTHMPHLKFNPNNFKEMIGGMENGRDIIIAAHNPTRNWKLADNPGIGDIYLSQLTGAPIIPVALDIHTVEPMCMAHEVWPAFSRLVTGTRPEATLRIGSPIYIERIPKENLKHVVMFLSRQRVELASDPTSYANARATYQFLREQAGMVMEAIAQMLPEAKRGRWK